MDAYDASRLADVESDKRRILLSIKCVNLSQLFFRKFHLFTALLGMGLIGLTCEMNDSLCCDLGNTFRANHLGEGLMLAKARSGWLLSSIFQSGSYSVVLGHKAAASQRLKPSFQVFHHLG